MTAAAFSLADARYDDLVPVLLAELRAEKGVQAEIAAQAIVDAAEAVGICVDVATVLRQAGEAIEVAAKAREKINGAEREHEPPAAGDKASHLIGGSDFLKLISPPVYVARPTIQRGQVIAMTGKTNHGKTTIAHLHIVGCLTGQKIGPLRFRKGKVLLLVGENPGNSAVQFLAAIRRYGLHAADLANLIVRPAPGKLALVADELKREVSAEIALVVIDTSTAFFSYEDENDNVQLHQHAQDAAELTKLAGNPAVLILCHPIKGATRDNLQPRGGGAFLNAIDANLTVWNDGETVELHHTKVRGPGFEPIAFRLEPQDVGLKDEENVPLVPVVAVPLSEDDAARLERQQREEQNRVLYAMLAHPSESLSGWAEVCGWTHANGPAKTKVLRILKDLVEDKLVRKYRKRYVLTETGKKEAERCA